ncbi:hypothetical protein BDR26DRAFT_935997 [Obelidium mucronatum]|nr:hypothetical protein BDR26DRAFT_935997 [Obelidium mucronatum]
MTDLQPNLNCQAFEASFPNVPVDVFSCCTSNSDLMTCNDEGKITALLMTCPEGEEKAWSGSSFPYQIQHLTSLEQIYLDGCAMVGSLPEIFQYLPNLFVLDLKSNQFHSQIPNTIGTLNKMRWLQLQNNRFSGNVPFGLIEHISTMECSSERHCSL